MLILNAREVEDLSVQSTAQLPRPLSNCEVVEIRASPRQSHDVCSRISSTKVVLRRVLFRPIADDGEANVDLYNQELEQLREQGRNSWIKAPWLYAECYLYRRLRSLFLQQPEWTLHDPFLKSKLDSFRSSKAAVLQLAYATQTLCEKPETDVKVCRWLRDDYVHTSNAVRV